MKRIKDKIHNRLEKTGAKLNFDLLYFVENGFWVMLRQAFVLISSFILSILITRYLTKNEYGQYQLLISFLEMFAFFSIPGLASSVLRSVAKEKEGVYDASLKTRLKYSLLTIPIFWGLAIYFYYQTNNIISLGLVILSVFFVSIYSFNTWTQLFQGKGNFKNITVARIIFSLAQLLLFFVILRFFNASVLSLFFAYLGTTSVFHIIMFYFGKRFVKNRLKQEGWKKYGFFLTKINILNTITGKLDYILVGYLINLEALAIYAIGVKSAKVLQGIFKNLLMTTTPKIAKTKTISAKAYISIFLISSVIAIGFILIIPTFIELAYTNKYSESIYLSQIVIAFLPAFIINNIYEKHIKFYLADKRVLLIANIIFPITNIIMMFVLISFYDLIGLALSFGLRSLLKLTIYKIISLKYKT